jgi:hypothetical protein
VDGAIVFEFPGFGFCGWRVAKETEAGRPAGRAFCLKMQAGFNSIGDFMRLAIVPTWYGRGLATITHAIRRLFCPVGSHDADIPFPSVVVKSFLA